MLLQEREFMLLQGKAFIQLQGRAGIDVLREATYRMAIHGVHGCIYGCGNGARGAWWVHALVRGCWMCYDCMNACVVVACMASVGTMDPTLPDSVPKSPRQIFPPVPVADATTSVRPCTRTCACRARDVLRASEQLMDKFVVQNLVCVNKWVDVN